MPIMPRAGTCKTWTTTGSLQRGKGKPMPNNHAYREMMSQEEFVAKGGTECPVCRSTLEKRDALSYNHQRVVCLSCYAVWVTVYQPVGYVLEAASIEKKRAG